MTPKLTRQSYFWPNRYNLVGCWYPYKIILNRKTMTNFRLKMDAPDLATLYDLKLWLHFDYMHKFKLWIQHIVNYSNIVIKKLNIKNTLLLLYNLILRVWLHCYHRTENYEIIFMIRSYSFLHYVPSCPANIP